MDPALLEAITYWWEMRKKRSYIRPAHSQAALQRNSFAAFWRYYTSPEEMDLKRFLRLTKAEFDAVYSKVRFRLEGHCPTHLRPIQGVERLAVFLRFLTLSFGFGANVLVVQIHCFWTVLLCCGSSLRHWDSTFFEICKEVAEAIAELSLRQGNTIQDLCEEIASLRDDIQRKSDKLEGRINQQYESLVGFEQEMCLRTRQSVQDEQGRIATHNVPNYGYRVSEIQRTACCSVSKNRSSKRSRVKYPEGPWSVQYSSDTNPARGFSSKYSRACFRDLRVRKDQYSQRVFASSSTGKRHITCQSMGKSSEYYRHSGR
uniref:Uncharacterized protein n=1 Tax=Ditylenchus dipsaci TaxID=166011 RepID=A0A915DXK0_9BILA